MPLRKESADIELTKLHKLTMGTILKVIAIVNLQLYTSILF